MIYKLYFRLNELYYKALVQRSIWLIVLINLITVDCALIMSVYSGFATRQQETFYNKLIEKAFNLMTNRLMMFFKNEVPQDELKWGKQMRKV